MRRASDVRFYGRRNDPIHVLELGGGPDLSGHASMRCGARLSLIRYGVPQQFVFWDGDLCDFCWDATQEDERNGLFRHPQPDDAFDYTIHMGASGHVDPYWRSASFRKAKRRRKQRQRIETPSGLGWPS